MDDPKLRQLQLRMAADETRRRVRVDQEMRLLREENRRLRRIVMFLKAGGPVQAKETDHAAGE